MFIHIKTIFHLLRQTKRFRLSFSDLFEVVGGWEWEVCQTVGSQVTNDKAYYRTKRLIISTNWIEVYSGNTIFKHE